MLQSSDKLTHSPPPPPPTHTQNATEYTVTLNKTLSASDQEYVKVSTKQNLQSMLVYRDRPILNALTNKTIRSGKAEREESLAHSSSCTQASTQRQNITWCEGHTYVDEAFPHIELFQGF